MKKQLHWPIGLATLFAALFVVLNYLYGYAIAFQSETNNCFFMFGREFLWGFLDHPGGMLRYAGRFLGQFYHHVWLGALIVSIAVVGLCVAFHGVLSRLRSTPNDLHALLPGVLLAALHTSNVYLIHDTLGLAASCGALLGYLSFRGRTWRRAYALLVTPVLYVLLGGYVWFFVAWVAAAEWLDGPVRSKLPFGIGYLVFSAALPFAACRWVFPISLRSALTYPITFIQPSGTSLTQDALAHFEDWSLIAVFFASMLLLPFWDGLRSITPDRPNRGRYRVALRIGLVVLAVLLLAVRYEAILDKSVACRRLYTQGNWDALLAETKNDASRNVLLQFMTNFALCRKGELLDEMFAYPQSGGPRGLLFNFADKATRSPIEDDTPRAMYNSDLYYEMGHINAAFRHAYSYLSFRGRTYEALKRMAQCNLVNGNLDLTTKYLNILEKTLFHADFARRNKALMADPSAMERTLGERRKRLPRVERSMFATPVVAIISQLETQPENRMAFDYLMAWFLLAKRLEDICTKPERYQAAGYESMPTHCQEALLLLAKQTGQPIELSPWAYDQAVSARVERFLLDLSRYRGRPGLHEQLTVLYGDTYLFYYFFVEMPAGQQEAFPANSGSLDVLRQE